MAAQRNSTRQRLVHAALELFAVQGVTDTTTKQIAELADVNEVTIFRQFGNKHGLLLAVIEEAGIFTNLGQNLVQQASQASSIYQALKEYATTCLQALEGIPEVVRSVVGESGQYPAQNREALGQGFTQANRYVAEYFATVINTGQLQTHLPAEKLASLLNGMLLGYAVIEFTSEFHELWQNREDFLENLVTLFLHGAVSQAPKSTIVSVEKVADLPAALVHSILQRAKKQGLQDYALMYVLFGAGLSATEVVRLERSHYIKETHQQLLQITQENIRQVPLNQWIMGKRYGSYQRNPLTQWLKSRKDQQSALFVNENGNPFSEQELSQKWQALTADLLTPEGHPPNIEQAQQTWCVDMLMRGIDLQNLSILTGWDTTKLQRYVHKAKEKTALEQATRLDQKI
ncbi:TetR family transcriptional regulator [Phormidium sp. LEGE 05292]|uniref:TetR family transcriptional regulator n=1 Tax=[Phormidium] sp. LEGE 05292 TaxID=767427 RepID=UPI00187F185A|nr:TetR family transcriptional regulator [Phormidium sp. LEGE 05292]MBE9227887.1 TetR family transcriptional regulator [Phormidium sp. LEGE 05292]